MRAVAPQLVRAADVDIILQAAAEHTAAPKPPLRVAGAAAAPKPCTCPDAPPF